MDLQQKKFVILKSHWWELNMKVKPCYPVISRLFPSLWKLRYYCSISTVPRAPLCCTSIINFPNRNLKPCHTSAFPFTQVELQIPKCWAMFEMKHFYGFPNKGREGDYQIINNPAEGWDTLKLQDIFRFRRRPNTKIQHFGNSNTGVFPWLVNCYLDF